MKNLIILTITFIIVFAGYSGWEILREFLELYYSEKRAEELAVKFFFTCVEIGFMGYVFIITRLIQDKKSYFYKVAQFILGLTIAAVIDRLFGDPFTVTKFDYVLFGLNVALLFINGEKIRAIGNKLRKRK